MKLNLIKNLQFIVIVALLTSAKFASAQDLIKDTRNDKTTVVTEQNARESIIYTTYHSIIKSQNLEQVNLFELTEDTPELYAKQNDYVNDAILLKKNQTKINSLIKEKPNHFQFKIPVTSEKSITLELIQVDFLGENFKVKTGDDKIVKMENKGLFYHGYVRGNANSLAAISVFENEIRGVVSDSGGDYVLASLNEEEDISIFYNDKDLKNQVSAVCGMEDTEKYLNPKSDNNLKNHQKSNSLGCVDIRIECDYSFYQAHNSTLTDVYQYVLALFNEGVVIYANETIDLKLEEIIVWNTPSPYTELTSSSDPGDVILDEYTEYRKNMDDGPINNLLYSRQGWSGGWAWVDYLCQPYDPALKRGPFCVTNNRAATLTPFPNYSEDLGNFVHEIGHVLGSRHTHDCVWGPNSDTALDNCNPPYQPNVTQPICSFGPAPTNGGTIMSYCNSGNIPPGETVQVATLYGIDLINGLGDFPGTINNPRTLIADRVSNASCCSGADICNEGIFTQYPWLNPIVDKDNCTDETIDVYKLGTNYYINIYKNGQETIYYANGNVLCASSTSFNCVNWYGFTNLVDHWSCDCDESGTGTPTYCDSDGGYANYFHISHVSLEEIDNPSSYNTMGYEDHTSGTAANLSKSQPYTLSVSKTNYSGFNVFYWRAWIDYDRSGTFETNEEVLTKNNESASPVSATFIVPPNAATGTTRMRVSMKYAIGSAPDSCGEISYGEVEDYTINIQATASCNAAVPTASQIINTGNVYCNFAYGLCQGHTGINKEFELTNLSTGAVSTYTSSTHYAAFPSLTQSTNYRYRVRLECGNSGTYGGWSPYHNFTTTSCKTEADVLGLTNYPNPFDNYTTIEFSLLEDSPVTLHVYDLTGRQVATLLDNESTTMGNHRVEFDGSEHASGMYIYKIQAGAYTSTGKMNLIK